MLQEPSGGRVVLSGAVMAAFDRAQKTLSEIPQLSPKVERVLRKCGEHVELVWEILMNKLQKSQEQLFVDAQLNEQQWTGEHLICRPVLLALQADCVSCRSRAAPTPAASWKA